MSYVYSPTDTTGKKDWTNEVIYIPTMSASCADSYYQLLLERFLNRQAIFLFSAVVFYVQVHFLNFTILTILYRYRYILQQGIHCNFIHICDTLPSPNLDP